MFTPLQVSQPAPYRFPQPVEASYTLEYSERGFGSTVVMKIAGIRAKSPEQADKIARRLIANPHRWVLMQVVSE